MKTFRDIGKIRVNVFDGIYYIELLSPLETSDFDILTRGSNAIHFITGNSWSYTYCGGHNVGSEGWHKATLKMQLSGRDKLIDSLSELLGDRFLEREVGYYIGDIFKIYEDSLSIYYSYSKRNGEVMLEKLKDRIRGVEGRNKESKLYRVAISELTDRITYHREKVIKNLLK